MTGRRGQRDGMRLGDGPVTSIAARARRLCPALAATGLALLLAPGGAMASVLGEWCNDAGDTVLYLEADGFGIGEHRVCDWAEPPAADADSHRTRALCREVHLNGDTVVVVDETDYDLSLRLLDDEHLQARFDDGISEFDFTYRRCNA